MNTLSPISIGCVLLISAWVNVTRAERFEFVFVHPWLEVLNANRLVTDTGRPGIATTGSRWGILPGELSMEGIAYIGTPEEPVCLVGQVSGLHFSQGTGETPQLAYLNWGKGGLSWAGRWVRTTVHLPGVRQQIPNSEYAALVSLYNSTGGQEWARQGGWDDPTALSWSGVTISGFEYDWTTGQIVSVGTVTGLHLYDLGLNGPMPESIGDLTNLESLWVGYDGLKGPLPVRLGTLSKLQTLFISSNELDGTIPNSIGNLVNLQELSLPQSRLTGSIPDTFGNLRNLRILEIGDRNYGVNQLGGKIPESLGRLASLQVLSLIRSGLSGEIPSSLAELANLETLDLSGNKLGGPIPASFGKLGNLIRLSLADNQLNGGIPESLGQLANLETLELGRRWASDGANQLGGTIPGSLGQLANLRSLQLAGIGLTGDIPASLGSLPTLQRLDLSNNQLSGSVPWNLGNLPEMDAVYLDHNWFSGYIPTFSLSFGGDFDIRYNCFDISPGSQVRQVVRALWEPYNSISYKPQNLGCGPVAFGDLNNDGCVDRADLSILLAEIRLSTEESDYDLNGDGRLDIADARFLTLFFSSSGGSPCYP